MAIVYNLPTELRAKLKEPLGTLVPGSFAETMNRLKEMVREGNPTCIISVGDTVSKNLEKNHILQRLSIIDNKAMRRTTKPFSSAAEKTVNVRNPKATITDEAIAVIRDSLRDSSRTRIVVDGEEDLLALIAILYAPEDSFVVYGQPYEGIVVVKTTQAKKEEVSGILKSMENPRKAK
jgi:uncharacterized protein (UPF0218 family)